MERAGREMVNRANAELKEAGRSALPSTPCHAPRPNTALFNDSRPKLHIFDCRRFFPHSVYFCSIDLSQVGTEDMGGSKSWRVRRDCVATCRAARTQDTSRHLVVLLSTFGVLSLNPEFEFTTPASLPPSDTDNSSQSLHLYPIGNPTTLLPPSVLALVPPSSKAHLAFVVPTFTTPAAAATSFVDITQKKFAKTKGPSLASMIDQADASAATASETVRCQVKLALFDPEVVQDGVVGMRIVSLGKVAVPGSQVVVSEDAYVSALSSSGSLKSYRLSFSGTTSFASVYADLFTEAVSTDA
ncbi:hypothetical protein P7C70_g7501, partial [Phenoliferia sp. Uapishka_3]